jgi:hypothetical protein
MQTDEGKVIQAGPLKADQPNRSAMQQTNEALE